MTQTPQQQEKAKENLHTRPGSPHSTTRTAPAPAATRPNPYNTHTPTTLLPFPYTTLRPTLTLTSTTTNSHTHHYHNATRHTKPHTLKVAQGGTMRYDPSDHRRHRPLALWR